MNYKVLCSLVFCICLFSCFKGKNIGDAGIINNRQNEIYSNVVEYNINDLFQINIPNEIEIIIIDQYLRIKNDNTQYCIVSNFYFIYENKYFTININCFGNGNRKIFDGSETFNMRIVGTYSSDYNMADQPKYLLPNYIERPIINRNNVKFSRFVSFWPSGRTSDYYGLYFKISNEYFSDCIISINNIWGSFAENQKLIFGDDVDYKEKYLLEGGSLEDIFQLLEILEESITFTISNNALKIIDGFNDEKYTSDFSFIVPTINDLRMRKNPSLDAEVFGYMKNEIYQIIIVGNELEIDGIKGNWILIKPGLGNNLTWVFSGYTRSATEEEIYSYFEGS